MTTTKEVLEHAKLQITDILISKIDPAPVQLRRLEIGIMEDMARSVDQVGWLQPILVRPKGERFEVVFGNHRLEVARQRNHKIMPCIIKNLDDDESILTAVVENTQRNAHLDSSKEGEIFDDLCEEKSWTVENIARKIGKSTPYVYKRLYIFRHLHPKLLNKLSKRQIGLDVTYDLARFPMRDQLGVAEKFMKTHSRLKAGIAKCYHCPIHCPQTTKDRLGV